MFYIKGNNKGPVDLDKFWVKEGLLKMKAVIMDFLT